MHQRGTHLQVIIYTYKNLILNTSEGRGLQKRHLLTVFVHYHMLFITPVGKHFSLIF